MVRLCLLIPVFDHEDGIRNTMEALREYPYTCIVVDDGSSTSCGQTLDRLADANKKMILVRHSTNRGKGAAVKTGLRKAADLGFSHALQIDADCQHDLAAIGPAVDLCRAYPNDAVLGYPQYDASVPLLRLASRYLTHFWVWVNTLSFAIKDSMCGFRIYPVPPTIRLLDAVHIGDHMEFDIEVAVQLHWHGVSFQNTPVVTIYPDDGISHFRMMADNWRITKMHARLFFGMLRRIGRHSGSARGTRAA